MSTETQTVQRARKELQRKNTDLRKRRNKEKTAAIMDASDSAPYIAAFFMQ